MTIDRPEGIITNTAAGYGSSAWIGVRLFPAPVPAGRRATPTDPGEWPRPQALREEQGWLAGQWAAPGVRRFEIRYANDPRSGLLTCTLLGATHCADAGQATAAAVALRESLRRVPAHLRAEPILDTGELARRLTPFDIAAGESAEIRKRLAFARFDPRAMPYRPLGVDVRPLGLAGPSWDPVWNALADLPYPAMVGVCLAPCHLGGENLAAFRFLAREYARLAGDERRGAVPHPFETRGGADPFAAQAQQSFGAATDRYAGQVFRLRASVASAGPLPSHLVGFLADAVGGVGVPIGPADAAASARAIRTLDHDWLESSYGRGVPAGGLVHLPERALSEAVDTAEAAAVFRLPLPSPAAADAFDPGEAGQGRPAALAVVLTALEVEHAAVSALLGRRESYRHESGLIIETGILPGTGWQVALAAIGPGAPGAASITQLVTDWLRPQVLFFVGVAGALREDVAPGDVVVATKVYSYGGGRSTDAGFHSSPEAWLAPLWLKQEAAVALRGDAWTRRQAPGATAAVPNGHGPPRVHFKPVAAGDVVLDSTRSWLADLLRERYADAVAIEMESAGVMQAAHVIGNLPVLIVRGISDRADGDKAAADRSGGQSRGAAHAAAAALTVIAGLDPRAPQARMR